MKNMIKKLVTIHCPPPPHFSTFLLSLLLALPAAAADVAEIVETGVKYSGVYDAVKAATAGQTVKMLADSKESVLFYNNLTLDLNGHVLQANGNYTVQVNAGSNVTIKDTDKSVVHNFKVGSDGLWTLTTDAKTVDFENLTARPAANEVVAVKGGVITGASGTNAHGIDVYGTNNIYQVNVIGNNTTGSNISGSGAGVVARNGGVLNGEGCVICGNVAGTSGGGVYTIGTVDLRNSKLSFNKCANYGGGLDDNGDTKSKTNIGTATLTDCEVIGNEAKYGGGVHNGWKTTLKGTTVIAGNTASTLGGGVSGYGYWGYEHAGQVTIDGRNVCITGNTCKANAALNNYAQETGYAINLTGDEALGSARIGIGQFKNTSATTPIDPPAAVTAAGTGSGTADDVAYFTSDDPTYIVVYDTDHLELKIPDIKVQPTAVDNTTVVVTTNGVPVELVGGEYLVPSNSANVKVVYTASNTCYFADGSTAKTNDVNTSTNPATLPAAPAAPQQHKHCLCGASGSAAHCAAAHTQTELIWKAWTSTTTLPTSAGNWYLVNDVTLTATYTPPTGVNLCLNGHVVKQSAAASVITVNSGVNLTLTDCEKTEHKYVVDSSGVWNWNDSASGGTAYESLTARPAANAVISVKGGCITGGKCTTDNGGGAIYLQGQFALWGGNLVGNSSTCNGGAINTHTSGIVVMNGGRIIGNRAENVGGGVFVYQAGSKLTMNGGTIAFNRGIKGSGGVGVWSGRFVMIGGDVSYNLADSTRRGGGVAVNTSGAAMTVGGDVKIVGNKYGNADDNLYLIADKTLVVTNAPALAAGAQIGVTTATKPSTTTALVPVTSNRGEDLAYFTSDEGHLVVNEAGKVQFKFVLNVAFYANHADVTRDGAAFSSTNAVLNYGSTDGIPTLACGDLIFAGWTKTVGGTTPDYRTAEEVSTMSTVSGSFQLYAVWADKLVLGEFAPLTQTFPDAVATADPELTYKQVTLMFTREMTGETFVLPTGAQYSNYVKNTSLSTDYSCVIDLTTAQTAAEIATNYLRQVKFRGCVNQELRVVLGPKTSYKTFYNIDTQHYYQYVPFDWMYNPKTWIESYNLAKGMTYAGRKGYLATVTSLKEDSFIYNAANEVGWLGGTHMKPTTLNGQYYDGFTPSQSLSYWYWACGPECGDEFFDAKNLKDTSYAGNAAKGYYFNWDNGEPNGGVDNNKENCLTTLRKGAGYSTGSTISKYSWNDSEYNRHDGTGPYGPDYMPRGFFVEYGDKKIGDTSEPEEGEVVSGVRGYAIAVADIVAPYVAFNAWGGYHGDDPSCEVTSNVCVDGVYTLPRFAPTRTGYDFSGWFASWTNGAAQAIKDEEMFVQGPHTVYAQWISKSVPQGEGAKTFEYETTGDGTGALLKGATNKLETTDLAIPEFVDNGTGGSIPYVIIQKDAFAYDNYDKKRERDLQEAGVSEAESVTNDLTSVTVSTYVTNIQSYAFYSCAQLTNVTFSKTRDYKTGEKAVLHVRDWAFEGSGVKSVTFPADSKVVLDYGCFAEAEYLRDITFLGDVELKARYPFVGSGTRIFNADGSRAKVTLHLSAKLASDPAFVASLTNGMSNVRVDLSQKIEGGDRTGSVVIKSGPTVSGGNVTFAFTVSEESNWLKVTEDTVYLFWSTTLTDAKTFIGNEPLKPTTLSGPDANGVYTATFVKPATPESTAAYFQLAIGDAR